MADAALNPNAHDILFFLESFGGTHALVCIDPEKKKPLSFKVFDNPREAAEWAASSNRSGMNVYFHVNTIKAGVNKKATKREIAEVRYLHVDIDARVGDNLDSELARIQALFTANLPKAVPAPTWVVGSGGGYWGFWRLTSPIEIKSEDDVARVEGVNKELSNLFGGDDCHNIDRIARLPGTVNWPDEKKKRKGRLPARAQLVEGLCNATSSLPISAFPTHGETLASNTDTMAVASAFHPDFADKLKSHQPTPEQTQLLDRLSSIEEGDLIRKLNEKMLLSDAARLQATYCVRGPNDLTQGDDGTLMRVEPAKLGCSDSEIAVAFAGQCLRDGLSLELIMSFLVSGAWKISSHVLRQGKPLRAARRAVAEAILNFEVRERILDECGAPPFSDEYMALLFAKQHESSLRYVDEWGSWYIWKDNCWFRDKALKVNDNIRAFLREAARDLGSENDAQKALKKRICSVASFRAVGALAKSDPRISVSAEVWDRDTWSLNTPSGLIDLKTGEIRPHDSGAYCTKLTGCEISHEEVSPDRWLKFLEEVTGGDREYIDYLQRMTGYFLTGQISEHALFFAWGTGRNGKSVFTNTLRKVLGDYATSTPQETLTANSQPQHPTELADLRGARLVTSQEMEDNKRWAESRVKQMTGGDPIKARFMHQDFFEYRPQFKLFIAGNHKPGLSNVNTAMQRRIHLLPFVVTIPEEKVDRELESKLALEAPSILRWMVQGSLKWQREGLERPKTVKEATDDYIQSEDVFARWISECCLEGSTEKVMSGDLYRCYTWWCDENKERCHSQNKLTTELKLRNWQYDKTGGQRGFIGWAIRDDIRQVMKTPRNGPF